MSNLPPLYVLRHGETEWNVAGRLQGAMDSPLTEKGRVQARAQGGIVTRLGLTDVAWRVSPQGRALQTAALIRGAEIPSAEQDARLREIEMGDWTGKARADIAQANPALFESDGLAWYDHAPGGEGLAALAARAADVLSDIEVPTLIVTHGITSRVLRCLATHRPWEELDQVGGGQGVVYEIRDGVQILHR